MIFRKKKHTNRFVNERMENWEQLERLIEKLEKKPIRFLPRNEIKRLGALYRSATSDLAVARVENQNPKLIKYLNSLVIRAHGKIYRAESQGFSRIKNFFLKDFPATFRRHLNYFLFSAFLFTVLATFSFVLSYVDSNFAEALGLSSVKSYAASGHKWWLRINEANPIEATNILTNNIMVTFQAFAYGVFFCLGTIYILALNALIIGGIFGVCYSVNSDFGFDLLAFVSAHGFIELSCIFIAGAAGLMIGYSIADPGEYRRIDALKIAGFDATRLILGAAFFLVVAGFIEGFISPSDLPSSLKFITGISSGLFMYSYLFLAGRGSNNDSL
ncbi:MAG: stage II sporulation protein M [Pyrinomonadaceae bacterium]|nr:stage II sporulation protein M [Pyrinomonadaceae bacterium]MCX7639934.1 stage II sporulation protein M [Pyrinomonadaceae bacterium]MDW8304106.1 stage II sporulation protein M [Acidobacteriota bacterium]